MERPHNSMDRSAGEGEGNYVCHHVDEISFKGALCPRKQLLGALSRECTMSVDSFTDKVERPGYVLQRSFLFRIPDFNNFSCLRRSKFLEPSRPPLRVQLMLMIQFGTLGERSASFSSKIRHTGAWVRDRVSRFWTITCKIADLCLFVCVIALALLEDMSMKIYVYEKGRYIKIYMERGHTVPLIRVRTLPATRTRSVP